MLKFIAAIIAPEPRSVTVTNDDPSKLERKLEHAIISDDVASTHLFLDNGASKSLGLKIAVQHDKFAMCELLIKRNAYADVGLKYAMAYNKPDLVKYFVSKGGKKASWITLEQQQKLRQQQRMPKTPPSVQKGWELVDALCEQTLNFEKISSLEKRSPNYDSAISYAARNKLRAVEYLSPKSSAIGKGRALANAIEYGNTDIANFLCNAHPDYDYACFHAAVNKSLNTFKILSPQASVYCKKWAMWYAVSRGKIDMISFLVESGFVHDM